jgi:hypothetical protein
MIAAGVRIRRTLTLNSFRPCPHEGLTLAGRRDEHFTTNIVSHHKRFISLNFFAPVRKMSECFGQGEQLLEQEKTLVEGAGSVGFAALCNRKIEGAAGKSVAVVVSGGNIDLNVLSTILERGRAKDGRLTHLKVVLPDKPGTLVELSAVLAGHRGNVLQLCRGCDIAPAIEKVV